MLLKSIKLENFRQFIKNEISFSTNKEKNVTFVLANNTAGKTTLANAFTWCLFGKANFPNPILLNRKVHNEMKIYETRDVSVEVNLVYGEQDFSIKRTLTYQLNSTLRDNPKLNVKDVKLVITCKNLETGITETVDETKQQDLLNLIIPQDIADYLFLKAELINNMGSDIEYKRISGDLSSAVKKILGMQAIENAITHLTKMQNSAYSIFNKRYSGNSDAQIQKIMNDLEGIDSEVAKKQDYIDRYNKDIEDLTERNAELIAEIKKYEDGSQIQNEIARKERGIREFQSSKEKEQRDFYKSFISGISKLCYKKLVPEILTVLKNTEIEDKNVPNVTNKTIECLLKRGFCICGTKLDNLESEAYKTLYNLLEYVPPKYIGASVASYIATAKTRLEDIPNLVDAYEKNKVKQLTYQSRIDDLIDEIEKLSKKLQSCKDTSEYEKEKRNNLDSIKRLSDTIGRYKADIQKILDMKQDSEEKLKKLSQSNSQNKYIADCMEHVEYISAILERHLTTKEKELRENLQAKINDIFSEVFTKDYNILIDKTYRLTITDTLGTPQDIDTSGAQSVSVILAFITSVLSLAQKIHYDRLKNKEEAKFLITEPYPLVLDAPFSAFDEERITTACKRLPELTEQIIIFSKDTEGNLIKKYMRDRIGKFYTMEATTLDDNNKDVLETAIMEGDINDSTI